MKGLPYALALLALGLSLGLGTELDNYGHALGVGRVPSVGAFIGILFGVQTPLLRKGFPAISKPRLGFTFGCVLILIPLVEAFIGCSSRRDAPFATYLWVSTLDLAIGVAAFFLLLPLGTRIANRTPRKARLADGG